MFKTIEVNGKTIIKLGKLWCKEGGDGEMYPIVGQKEAEGIYEQVYKQKLKDEE